MKKPVNLYIASSCGTYYVELQHYKNGFEGYRYLKRQPFQGECGFHSCAIEKLIGQNIAVSMKSFPANFSILYRNEGAITRFSPSNTTHPWEINRVFAKASE